MAIRRFANITELHSLVGQELAVSEWLTVPQSQIMAFADATYDHQWIHTDVERAAREAPTRTTIAHGFLTLALLAPLYSAALDVDGTKVSLNYGFNRVRFTSPVLSGDRIRGRFLLAAYEDLAPGAQLTWKVTVERDGGQKPVLVAEWLMRRYP
jgi:acyl dehydratase